MFHSKKLITEAALASAGQPQSVAALPPKARPPSRRPLWFALGGVAIAALVGAGWLMARPVCGCGLPPINPINLKSVLNNPQPSRPVTLPGRMTQARPVHTALADKGGPLDHRAIRADALRPGADTAVLSQPVHAGSSVAH